MQLKTFEVRDRMTHIPAFAIRMSDDDPTQSYQLRRAGYAPGNKSLVLFGYLSGGQVNFDPHSWKGQSRTMSTAHTYIQDNWDILNNGDVIDVQYILDETDEIKKSERINEFPS